MFLRETGNYVKNYIIDEADVAWVAETDIQLTEYQPCLDKLGHYSF